MQAQSTQSRRITSFSIMCACYTHWHAWQKMDEQMGELSRTLLNKVR